MIGRMAKKTETDQIKLIEIQLQPPPRSEKRTGRQTDRERRSPPPAATTVTDESVAKKWSLFTARPFMNRILIAATDALSPSPTTDDHGDGGVAAAADPKEKW